MEWISIKDRMPDDYDVMYVVLTMYFDKNGNQPIILRLNKEPYSISFATWDKADLALVNYYREKGDHSWDWAAEDHWSECYLDSTKITHWFKLPALP